jgi:hypothetical protein
MGSSLGVADTMAIIAAKLPALVPFSCCALFIYDEEIEVLRCRFASGLDADLIRQVAQGGASSRRARRAHPQRWRGPVPARRINLGGRHDIRRPEAPVGQGVADSSVIRRTR